MFGKNRQRADFSVWQVTGPDYQANGHVWILGLETPDGWWLLRASGAVTPDESLTLGLSPGALMENTTWKLFYMGTQVTAGYPSLSALARNIQVERPVSVKSVALVGMC